MKKNYKFLITIVIIAVAIYVLVRFLNKDKNGNEKIIIKDILNIPDELGCLNPSFTSIGTIGGDTNFDCDTSADPPLYTFTNGTQQMLEDKELRPRICFGDTSCNVARAQDWWNWDGKLHYDSGGKNLKIDGKFGCKTKKAFAKVMPSTGGCYVWHDLVTMMKFQHKFYDNI